MSLSVKTRIGEDHAVYLPRAVAKAVGLKEGDRVLLRVMDGSVVVEPLMDPIELGLHGDKYAAIDPERIEGISVGEQETRVKGSS